MALELNARDAADWRGAREAGGRAVGIVKWGVGLAG